MIAQSGALDAEERPSDLVSPAVHSMDVRFERLRDALEVEGEDVEGREREGVEAMLREAVEAAGSDVLLWRDEDGMTLSHHAAVMSSGTALRVVAAATAQATGDSLARVLAAKDEENEATVLHLAVCNPRMAPDDVRWLLSDDGGRATAAEAVSAGGELPVHYMLMSSQRPSMEMVRNVVEAFPLGLSVRGEYGQLPLHNAALNRDMVQEVFVYIVEQGPDGALRQAGDDGNTPVHALATTYLDALQREGRAAGVTEEVSQARDGGQARQLARILEHVARVDAGALDVPSSTTGIGTPREMLAGSPVMALLARV